MASNVQEESSPLLSHQFPEPEKPPKANGGLPVTHGGVVAGEPINLSSYDSGLLACLGRNDEFCGSDLEVCVLGSVAPCVLYGTNAERLSSSESFADHFLCYTGLYLIGNAFFGGNCIAQGFAARNRTDMRHKFNLQGGCVAFQNSCGCCGSMGEEGQERCDSFCDMHSSILSSLCPLPGRP